MQRERVGVTRYLNVTSIGSLLNTRLVAGDLVVVGDHIVRHLGREHLKEVVRLSPLHVRDELID